MAIIFAPGVLFVYGVLIAWWLNTLHRLTSEPIYNVAGIELYFFGFATVAFAFPILGAIILGVKRLFGYKD